VIDLLRDPARRASFEDAAAATAARHDWSAVAAAFARVLQRAAEGPAVMPMVGQTAGAGVCGR
jgi:hypothetical protein